MLEEMFSSTKDNKRGLDFKKRSNPQEVKMIKVKGKTMTTKLQLKSIKELQNAIIRLKSSNPAFNLNWNRMVEENGRVMFLPKKDGFVCEVRYFKESGREIECTLPVYTHMEIFAMVPEIYKVKARVTIDERILIPCEILYSKIPILLDKESSEVYFAWDTIKFINTSKALGISNPFDEVNLSINRPLNTISVPLKLRSAILEELSRQSVLQSRMAIFNVCMINDTPVLKISFGNLKPEIHKYSYFSETKETILIDQLIECGLENSSFLHQVTWVKTCGLEMQFKILEYQSDIAEEKDWFII